MHWVPGRGLAVEMASLALRLTLVVLLNGAIAGALLALLCALLQRVEENAVSVTTPAGMPRASQPRTVERP